jgi:Phage late-transcription coactivator
MDKEIEYILTDSLIITKKFRSPNEFSLYIEEKVTKEQIGYMDAIIQYCEEIDIDIESISKLVNQSLKDKVQNEAEEQNYIKRRGKLPL